VSKISLSLSKKNDRSCGDCTRCCEGWLSATIKGEDMYPGKPCQFVEVGVGCNIYKNRPKNPCKTFECMWKSDAIVPEEFKPSKVASLIAKQEVNGIGYLSLVECGEKIDSEVLSWFTIYCLSNLANAFWTVDGKPYWMGDPEFNAEMDKRYQSNG